jgi:hypothetical protein
MAPHEIAKLTAQVNALDKETARRVARLVLECRASLELALLAVQDANSGSQAQVGQQPKARKRLAHAFSWKQVH